MTPIFKAITPPPPPKPKQENPFERFERFADNAYKFGIDLNEQREAVGLPRINQIDEEKLPVFRQMIEIENEPKALKCPSCGANIEAQDMKCKYCGTAFYWERENPCLNWVKENPYLKAKEMVKK